MVVVRWHPRGIEVRRGGDMVNGTPGGGLWGDVRDTRRESSRFVARTGRGVAPNRRGRPLRPAPREKNRSV